MSDFKAKMQQIVCRLGLRPRPRWGSLQRSPRPPSWILEGRLLLRGGEGTRGEDTRGEGKGRERREGEGRKEGMEGRGRGGIGREGAVLAPKLKLGPLPPPRTIFLAPALRSHFLIDFHQNWHRRKNPEK